MSRRTSSAVVLPVPEPPVRPTMYMSAASRAEISSASSAPGRRILKGAPAREIIVDSVPMPHSPPSMTASIFPSKYSSTCAAVLGLGAPEGFALGAARGRAHF